MATASTTDMIGNYCVTVNPRWKCGRLGDIFRAVHIDDQTPAVVKKIAKVKGNNTECVVADDETKVLRALQRHNNVVKLLKSFHSNDADYVIMEYCELGDLGQYLKDNIDIDMLCKVDIMHQLSSAVDYMHTHQPQICHCDINLDHVLLKAITSQIVVKLTGFGMSSFYKKDRKPTTPNHHVPPRFRHDKCQNTSSKFASEHFLPPECFVASKRSLGNNAYGDVFALGLLMSVIVKYGPGHIEYNPLTVPNTDLPRRSFVGKVMAERNRVKQSIPTVVEWQEFEDTNTRRLKRMIINMTNVCEVDRPQSTIIAEELREIYLDMKQKISFQTEIDKLKQNNNELLVKWNQTKDKQKDQAKLIDMRDTTIYKLTERVEKSQSLVSSKKEQIESMDKAKAEMESKIQSLKQNRQRLVNDVTFKGKEIENLQARNVSCECKIENQRASVNDLRVLNASFKNKIKENIKHIEHLVSTHEDAIILKDNKFRNLEERCGAFSANLENQMQESRNAKEELADVEICVNFLVIVLCCWLCAFFFSILFVKLFDWWTALL